ncbi:hypothetical protein WA158_000765 [Blastocystis sp. Blastoise]
MKSVKGQFDITNDTYVCWLTESIYYQKLHMNHPEQRVMLGEESDKVFFVLYNTTNLWELGCVTTQKQALRPLFDDIMNNTCLINSSYFYRKPNKYKWSKIYCCLTTTKDMLFFEDETLEKYSFRFRVESDCQIERIQGTESPHRYLLEIRQQDKGIQLSPGMNESDVTILNDWFFVLTLITTGIPPSTPIPNTFSWILPIEIMYRNNHISRGIFEEEAMFHEIPMEIRPKVWKSYSNITLFSEADYQDISIYTTKTIDHKEEVYTYIQTLAKQLGKTKEIENNCLIVISYYLYAHGAYPVYKTLTRLYLYLASIFTPSEALSIEIDILTSILRNYMNDIYVYIEKHSADPSAFLYNAITSCLTGLPFGVWVQVMDIYIYSNCLYFFPAVITLLYLYINKYDDKKANFDEDFFTCFLQNIEFSQFIQNYRQIYSPSNPIYNYISFNYMKNQRKSHWEAISNDISIYTTSQIQLLKEHQQIVEKIQIYKHLYKEKYELLLKYSNQKETSKESITQEDPYSLYYSRLLAILSKAYDTISSINTPIYKYKIFINTNIYDLNSLYEYIQDILESTSVYPQYERLHSLSSTLSSLHLSLMNEPSLFTTSLTAVLMNMFTICWQLNQLLTLKTFSESSWATLNNNNSDSNPLSIDVENDNRGDSTVLSSHIWNILHVSKEIVDFFVTCKEEYKKKMDTFGNTVTSGYIIEGTQLSTYYKNQIEKISIPLIEQQYMQLFNDN